MNKSLNDNVLTFIESDIDQVENDIKKSKLEEYEAIRKLANLEGFLAGIRYIKDFIKG